MENTIIRRTAQLVQDLRILLILENDDAVRCYFNKNLELFYIEVTFADVSVNEKHSRYQLIIYAFEKEFGKDKIEIIYPPLDGFQNVIKIGIML